MPYDWEDEEQTATHHSRVTVAVGTLRRLVRTLASYALALGALTALWSFLAPWVGAEPIAWWGAWLGPIAAPTERPDQLINVTPAIVGVGCTALALWLR
jgi:hypothetical protein